MTALPSRHHRYHLRGTMLHKTGDMFSEIGRCDILVITTNGYVKRDGRSVMGRGCAKTAKLRWPDIDLTPGRSIVEGGNRVTYLTAENGTAILSFPVKPATVRYAPDAVVSHAVGKYRRGEAVPGFHAKASLLIIQNSLDELIQWANVWKCRRIVMPRPGCGAGELSWSEVKPILESMLDDRFEVYTWE